MTPESIAALLQEQFPEAILTAGAFGPDFAVTVRPEQLVAVCAFLRDDPRLRFEMLNDVSGVDYLEPDAKKAPKAGFDPHVEVVYHLSSFSFPGRRFTLKVVLPRWANDVPGELPELPSVCTVWRTANWQEREVYDLLGVRFTDHPDLRRILLAEDWVGHPLRKDYEYPLEYHGIRCR
ncbi:MAG: NADH-quinone oxidoreductase subunit C [Bacteroidales bacterium]|nr:NADH-quinone oxidoreductase subunit C [Bacteroidales bacterium]